MSQAHFVCIAENHVLLDPRLKESPPSTWTLKTQEGQKSWLKHKTYLDRKSVSMTAIDRAWRSVEHKHLDDSQTRFYYMNDHFPNESYEYETKMTPCPLCQTK